MKYLATLICFLYIVFLFWRDRQKAEGHSSALWIPFAWMFFVGSRYVAGWLSLAGLNLGATTSDAGNPVNAVSFFLIIAAGVLVLSKRKIDWGIVLTQNKWIGLYLLYCGVSIAWSDYSLIAFKRWIKDLGNPIMVLVILTEKHPYQAFGVLVRRLGYLWLPISVLFIKYYPAWGREYTPGGMSWGGIAGEKNTLGLICFMSGIYYSWNFLLNRKKGSKLGDINDIILVGMLAWLLYMAHSATSFGCLAVAIGLLVLSKTRFMAKRPSRILVLAVTAASLYFVLDVTMGISDTVVRALGRDETLTNRTSIWKIVGEFPINPILGAGYQSFWAGERLQMLWARIGAQINQAHNGYLEQYLNLGYVGLAFIGIILLSGLLKVRRHLSVNYPAAVLRLCFIVTAILYNYTEASFGGLSNMWLLTLFSVIEISVRHKHGSVYSDGTESWCRMK